MFSVIAGALWCANVLKANQCTSYTLKTLFGSEPEFFARNKLGFLVRIVKRKT